MSIASEITRLQNAKSAMATSIANKGVTVPASTKLDGYSALIDQISGGSSSWFWLPDTAELVATADETINLSSDTDWDSWTPSTTSHTLKSSGSARGACSYTIPATDISSYGIIAASVMRAVPVYISGTTYGSGYFREKIMATTYFQCPITVEPSSTTYVSLNHGGSGGLYAYNSSATNVALTNSGTGYGFGSTGGAAWSTSSLTSSSARTVGWTSPALYSRCSNSYFSTTAAGKIDSASSNIYCKYRIWRVPKADHPLYCLYDATGGSLI